MQRTAESHLDIAEKILLNTSDLQELLSCGYSSAVKLGCNAHAKVKIGKRVLWNRKKIETYLNDITE